ncbi:MAG: T9SS C-terminal target domain-containing protein [Bacteroidetes bacterium]|nr:MAG: T9SS C-terminal target domain-containing protein [Bacteroidota bacterium]MBL1143864.1 T9SS C-terminal target domain-containing protein [Bacteroidota bacterium]NOG56665.1 T9SS type A sorting domain-containing protein [Bacteroidota bacterium]
MKLVKKIIILTLLLSSSSILFAKGPEIKKDDSKKQNDNVSIIAGCSPANKIVYLEFNNVRTRIESGGLWWQDRPNRAPDYEVPKKSNSFAIYAGGLWMAGTDINGQLKAAVTKFSPGDYWTGPLDVIGTAEISDATCREYDRFFEISKSDVLEFLKYRRALEEDNVEEKFPNGYSVPLAIKDWPGNGKTESPYFQAPKLAPYVDVNNDNYYDYEDGDYPYYDVEGKDDCRKPRINRSESATRPLFGDKTYWWIFNDKGNLHTASNAPSIGMEIHAQAFAFATNDAINDMTFYNFELINRSTFTLTDTYFASYVDPDLGYAADDFVGCDVGRGLGYCYNGDDDDEDNGGRNGYGSTPAAIGIDFFEGPYQDADGINNNIGIGIGEALNGLGYNDLKDTLKDTIVDNERYGMRRFVYYNIGGGQNGDPTLAIHYYNYMRGIWQNGQKMQHGGDGLNTAGVEGIPTAFMFPGKSDPLHWGTTIDGVTTVPTNLNWTEDNPGNGQAPNAKGDRRFLQSAGPFTLEPGNVNDITVGVVFAQAEAGGRLASVNKLIAADDKAQALFDNCFKVLEGPDAPDLTIQELDKELILYISNGELSNNYNEEYEEEDPNIVTPDTVEKIIGRKYDNKYRFQGYQIFQVKAKDVSVSQLNDLSLARLAFQCDIADGVKTLINYTFDDGLASNVAEKMVTGSDVGISHSFRVTEDLFATGLKELVNYKTYYYIAIAYGYNNFKNYKQGTAPDLDNPLAAAFDGQKEPYKASRKNSTGGAISSVAAIPHSTAAESKGTIINSTYGDLVGITRHQGVGNGNQVIKLTDGTINNLMEEKAWEDKNVFPERLEYKLGYGPLSVKVVDPLSVVDGSFVFKMLDENINNKPVVTDTAEWLLYRVLNGGNDTVYSERPITTRNEQILVDWGLSILVDQAKLPGGVVNGVPRAINNGYLGSSIEYADPTKPWFSGINDQDGAFPENWILSGTTANGSQAAYDDRQNNGEFFDPNSNYENILGGIMAPYNLVGYGTGSTALGTLVNKPGYNQSTSKDSKLEFLNSVTVILTKDKSKWTRCPVLEMQELTDRAIKGDPKYSIRSMGSIDKDGNQWEPGMPVDLTNPESASYIDSMGMGWFPGYAINVETGERMNMAYGEDSWYGVDNGADMIWNPTSRITSGVIGATNRVWGGKHVVYIFRKSLKAEGLPNNVGNFTFDMNEYDGAKRLVKMMRSNLTKPFAWRSCSWVIMPVLAPGQELLATDVRIDVNVARPFDIAYTDLYDTTRIGSSISVDSSLHNSGRPVFTFETRGFAVEKGNTSALQKEIERINVVPNPYYAISEYEQSAVDNLIKIINLPQDCEIKIYNMGGTLIRKFKKSDPANYLDWDLKNQVGIPISSGVYIIHINVPDAGEKILKWFGVMRPVDLNTF